MQSRPLLPVWIASFGLLFVAQLLLISTSVLPSNEWSPVPEWLVKAIVATNAKPIILGALPAAAIAFLVARLLRSAEDRTHAKRFSPKALIALWLSVWVVCWLALQVWLGGPDPGTWSFAVFRQPVVWFSFLLCGAALHLGARRGEA